MNKLVFRISHRAHGGTEIFQDQAGTSMDAKHGSGMALSHIPGTRKDVETICKDKSGLHVDGLERVH